MNKDQDWKKKATEIFKLLNDFRKNPRQLAKHLESLKKNVDSSKVLTEPGKIPIQMVEGVDVINEAINYLNDIKYLQPFELDPYLCQSAQEHVDDIGPKGLLSYQSSDQTEPEDRIAKYGNYVEALGENIDFGPNDALGVIVSLTLDDGEDERPHRDNLFKSDYKKIGIACGPHKSEYQMCVMDFAYDFLPREEISNNNNNINNDSMGNSNKNYNNNNINNNAYDNSKNRPFVNNNSNLNNNQVNNYDVRDVSTSKNNNSIPTKNVANNNNSSGGFRNNVNESNTISSNIPQKNNYNNNQVADSLKTGNK